MLSVFCSPSRYTQGKNATAVLGAEIAGLGLSGPALIVSSPEPSVIYAPGAGVFGEKARKAPMILE
jgi:hypothetical protein